MTSKSGAKLSIGKVSSSRGPDFVRIELRSEAEIIRIDLSVLDFALATFGQGYKDCAVEKQGRTEPTPSPSQGGGET